MSDQPEVLAIRVTMMPRDTNAHGTIFGGHILSLIDQAGSVACHTAGAAKVVTVAMRDVEFKEPVAVGDVVTCLARVTRIGRTSMTVCVRVIAQSAAPPGLTGPHRHVTQAEVVYVHVDEAGRPAPFPVNADAMKNAGPA